jgi:hypothetical protein
MDVNPIRNVRGDGVGRGGTDEFDSAQPPTARLPSMRMKKRVRTVSV